MNTSVKKCGLSGVLGYCEHANLIRATTQRKDSEKLNLDVRPSKCLWIVGIRPRPSASQASHPAWRNGFWTYADFIVCYDVTFVSRQAKGVSDPQPRRGPSQTTGDSRPSYARPPYLENYRNHALECP
ncbi:hypothetical protein ElyMa_000364100 [Elysia marginata]|uniref:Uncharacterized protein n=1 Tax=Elysia marginata TaxID=1093978 RepID=A0AAV4FHL2_9GAST|nr:hypothetical protein ElyMa_000364100 [Elysia marginata]